MTLSVSHTFQPRQIIRSAQVNTDINEIVDYVNDLETSVSDGTGIADGSITTGKIADNAITNAKLTDDCVTSVELRDDAVTDANRAVTTNHIRDSAVTTDKINASAVTEAKIATSVAGSGLTGGGGSALAVNVDNSTIEISTDTLQLKDGGTTETKLATAVQTKLGQNIGIVARVSSRINGTGHTTFEDVVNYSGQGRLDGIAVSVTDLPFLNEYELKITIDGTVTQTFESLDNTNIEILLNNALSTTMFKTNVTSTPTFAALNLFFRSSLLVQQRFTNSNSGNDATAYVQYERQA